jgi:hypothetical protein
MLSMLSSILTVFIYFRNMHTGCSVDKVCQPPKVQTRENFFPFSQLFVLQIVSWLFGHSAICLDRCGCGRVRLLSFDSETKIEWIRVISKSYVIVCMNFSRTRYERTSPFSFSVLFHNCKAHELIN